LQALLHICSWQWRLSSPHSQGRPNEQAIENRDELFGDLTEDELILEAVAASTVFFLQHAVEEYSKAVNDGHDRKASKIKECTPSSTLRCLPSLQDEHVLFITSEIRHATIHSHPKFKRLKCELPPIKLLLQEAIVVDKDRSRTVILRGDDTKAQFLYRMRKNGAHGIMSFGDLLAEEVFACIKAYDAFKDKPKAAIIKATRAVKPPLQYA
jgi:hypothetical protein